MLTATVFRRNWYEGRVDYVAEINNVYTWCELIRYTSGTGLSDSPLSDPLLIGVVVFSEEFPDLKISEIHCTYPVELRGGRFVRVGSVVYKE